MWHTGMGVRTYMLRVSRYTPLRISRRIARYVDLTSLAASIVLGVLAVGATGGFAHSGWGVALAAVVGVSQAVYTAINAALGGKLSKDKSDVASIAAGE